MLLCSCCQSDRVLGPLKKKTQLNCYIQLKEQQQLNKCSQTCLWRWLAPLIQTQTPLERLLLARKRSVAVTQILQQQQKNSFNKLHEGINSAFCVWRYVCLCTSQKRCLHVKSTQCISIYKDNNMFRINYGSFYEIKTQLFSLWGQWSAGDIWFGLSSTQNPFKHTNMWSCEWANQIQVKHSSLRQYQKRQQSKRLFLWHFDLFILRLYGSLFSVHDCFWSLSSIFILITETFLENNS